MILASMAALGAAYLGDKASTSVKMPTVEVPKAVTEAVASVSGSSEIVKPPPPSNIVLSPVKMQEETPII